MITFFFIIVFWPKALKCNYPKPNSQPQIYILILMVISELPFASVSKWVLVWIAFHMEISFIHMEMC